MMRLTDHTVNLMSQALALASAKYVDFAVEAANLAGGERVSAQFLKQAVETRRIAIWLSEGCACEIEDSYVDDNWAQADAERITMQLFADTAKKREAAHA